MECSESFAHLLRTVAYWVSGSRENDSIYRHEGKDIFRNGEFYFREVFIDQFAQIMVVHRSLYQMLLKAQHLVLEQHHAYAGAFTNLL